MSKLLREYVSLAYDQKLVKEAREQGRPIVLSGILQKSDTKNQNGRLYTRQVLEREVKNYAQIVSENRGLGTLDHEDCIREGAKILTKEGWKDFRDISENEFVYTLNPQNQNIELRQITRKIVQDYKGVMYHFKNRNIDTLVTPSHRFFVYDRKGNGSFVTAKEIFENRKKYSHHCIPKTGHWVAPESKDFFVIPGIDSPVTHKDLKEKYSKDLLVDIKTWSAFMGIYLSEGHAYKKYYGIQITQKKPDMVVKIRQLLSQFPPEIVWKERDRGNGTIDFKTHDGRLHAYLKKLGKSHEKYIPFEIKQLPQHCLDLLVEWFVLGDGRTRKCLVDDINYSATEIFSVSRRMMEDFNEVLLKTGASGNIQERIQKERVINGVYVSAEKQRHLHLLHFSTTKNIFLAERCIDITEEQYEGKIYCVTVPNETFYCMDSGKAFWSGNSAQISLEKVSHKVNKIWWEGNNVMGELQLLDTPKGKIAQDLLAGGVQVGISSRGCGDVEKNSEGVDVVGEDFLLISFDLVAEPSTPGAWLNLKEGKEISFNSLPKSVKINRLLNEILSDKK